MLPCGRSAHIEAGWFVGCGKPLYILLSEDQFEPELTYLMAVFLARDIGDLVAALVITESGHACGFKPVPHAVPYNERKEQYWDKRDDLLQAAKPSNFNPPAEEATVPYNERAEACLNKMLDYQFSEREKAKIASMGGNPAGEDW